MEDVLLEFESGIANLLDLFNKAKDEIGDKPVSKDIRNTIVDFVRSYKDYKVTLNGSSNEDIAEAAKMVCVYGQMFGQNLKNTNLDQKIKAYGDELENYAAEFRRLIESSPFLTFSLKDNEQSNITSDFQNYKTLRKQLDQISESHKLYDERIKKLLAESEQKAIRLQGKFEFLELEYKEKLEEVTEIYETELANIESKNKQLNEVIGEAASRVIISDYALSAEQERKTANSLRLGSLICMTLIIVIAGYSFLESVTQSFDLSNALLRLALVFLLSVPAAYLARESTKYRQQQYTHLQTSLDLKAINPYIASLPEEEQHKIKSEIAQRIFAPKDFQSISNESYPINSQEVIMALISKFGSDKDKQSD